MNNHIKKRISQILDPGHSADAMSRGVNIGLMALIFLNVLTVILETVPNLTSNYSQYFKTFEEFSVLIFTVEYGLRVWVIDQHSQNTGGKGRIKFLFSPMALIDLLAILPFYLPLLIPYDLRFLRILRLTRIFRLLKLAKYSQSMQLLWRVLVKKKEDLIITFTVAIILLVFASSIIYFVENKSQPNTFTSIPAAMWWTVGATTRLGVGPNPSTMLGMVFAALVALLGLGVFALPAGILASGLIEEIESNDSNHKPTCPKCGEHL
ncbi:MAG: ion transporter [Nitrospinaceae bacterium]|nr:ion transporter [Nitrospinaceae bacterium]